MHASGKPAECVGGHACMTQCCSTHAYTEQSAAQMSLQKVQGFHVALRQVMYSRKNLSVALPYIGTTDFNLLGWASIWGFLSIDLKGFTCEKRKIGQKRGLAWLTLCCIVSITELLIPAATISHFIHCNPVIVWLPCVAEGYVCMQVQS